MPEKEKLSKNAIRLREFSRLKFYDPGMILRSLRQLEVDPQLLLLAPEVRELRKRELRKHLEGRQAALFCYAMGKMLGISIEFACQEQVDFDCIGRWLEQDVVKYAPIQLKEAHHIQSVAQINYEIAKLVKYVDSRDTVIAMWVNGSFLGDLTQIEVPLLNLGEIWLYGSLSPLQDKWFLFGDLLKSPALFEWEYPV
jgi:hypothetical protein